MPFEAEQQARVRSLHECELPGPIWAGDASAQREQEQLFANVTVVLGGDGIDVSVLCSLLLLGVQQEIPGFLWSHRH